MIVDVQDELVGRGPDLRAFGSTILRYSRLIVATVLLTIVAALVVSALQTRVYESTASIVIGPTTLQNAVGSSSQDPEFAARTVATEVAVLQSPVVKNAARAALGHAADVTISSSITSDVVSVTARSDGPRAAATDANAYVSAYLGYLQKQTTNDLNQESSQINSQIHAIDSTLKSIPSTSPESTVLLQQSTSLHQQLYQLQLAAAIGAAGVLSNAQVPSTSTSPKPVRNAIIGVVLGLLIGLGLAFLRNYLEDSIITKEELDATVVGLPLLGEIPRVGRKRNRTHVVTLDSPDSMAAEAYRSLRTAMQFLGLGRKLCKIQVTSATDREGTSGVIANLGVEFARAGHSVVILSCDIRRPEIHEYFGLDNVRGLTSVLLGQVTLEEAMQQVPGRGRLALLAGGPPPPNPLELLSSSSMGEILSSLERQTDILLIDSPPVLPVSDALVVSGFADATLLVVGAETSSRRAVRRSQELLMQVDAPLVGVVFNAVSQREARQAFGNEGYGRGYQVAATRGRARRRSTRRQTHLTEPQTATASRPEGGERTAGALGAPLFESTAPDSHTSPG